MTHDHSVSAELLSRLRLPASDPLGRMAAYRLAFEAADAGWADARQISRYHAGHGIADQLTRALGSIGANVAEGYSRSSGRDRVRFFEYALGSARESRHWYAVARRLLDDHTLQERLNVLDQVVALLVTAIRAERTRVIRRGLTAPPRPHE